MVWEYIQDEYGGIPPDYLRSTYIYSWAYGKDKFPSTWSKRICKHMITKYLTRESGYVIHSSNSRGTIFISLDRLRREQQGSVEANENKVS
jgi:hypothetical protein